MPDPLAELRMGLMATLQAISLSSRPSEPAMARASRVPRTSTVVRLRRSMLLAASQVALIWR